MMKTAIIPTLALLAISALAMPVQAEDDLLPVPHVEGTCVVDDQPDYKVCVRTDNNCPRVTFRGFFGQGSIPYCW